jgi:4-hydroxybenzoate polyprenyltransferase
MPEPKSFRGRILGLLALLNIPLIFRPIAEILIGVTISIYFKNNGDVSQLELLKTLPLAKITLVIIISILLYMFSNSLNHIIHLKKDRKLYRHKPLVNGSLPLWLAWILCIVLFTGAGFIGYKIGNGTLLVIIALMFSLLFYNILSRRDKLPAAIMFAFCSLVNIYLGASAIIEVPSDVIAIFDSTINEFAVKEILLFFPISIFVFILGVMLVSTLEDSKPSPIKLAIANILILVGLIVPMGYKYVKVYLTGNVMTEFWTFEFITSMLLAGCLFLVLVVIMTIAAYENSPRNLHRIVVVGNIGVIWLCASVIASMDFAFAGVVIALLTVPAIMLYTLIPDPAQRRKI